MTETQMIIDDSLKTVADQYAKNIESVERFFGFDDEILKICLMQLSKGREALTACGAGNNIRAGFDKSIQTIENVKKNESLGSQYKTMYNQCVVLLISYFGSAVADVFRFSMGEYLSREIHFKKTKSLTLKVNATSLMSINTSDKYLVGELVAKAEGISFQDMQSIRRNFKEYLGAELVDDQRVVDNLIFSQACRNVFAHAGNKPSEKFFNQIYYASSRSIKPNFSISESELNFTQTELQTLIEDSKTFISSLISEILKYLKSFENEEHNKTAPLKSN